MNKRYSIVLSAIAGCVNVTTVYAFAMKVSHITGTLTQLVVEGQQAKWTELSFFIIMLGLFFIGGALSGYIFFDKPTELNHRHVMVLSVLGVAAAIVGVVPLDKNSAVYILSCMMGIQNGIYFVYNGAVLRTTHFTGYITDVGFVVGQWLKGVSVDKDKAYLFCFGMLFYILGGMIAAASVILTLNPLILVALAYVMSAAYAYKQTT